MQQFEWNKSYNIGHPLIDAQHRQLFEIINRLAVYEKTSTNEEVISDVLSKMTDYAGFHFKTEESYMQEINCPHLEAHKQEHRQFRIKVLELCQSFIKHQSVTIEDIFSYLIDWLVNHILHTDRRCIEHDKENASVGTAKS